MESDSQNLDEIVVVGYGTQRKKDVTSAISKVGGEDLANLAAPSFDTQLAGRAAGVQVTTPSGVLGSGPQFKVRGMSTISAKLTTFIHHRWYAIGGRRQQFRIHRYGYVVC